MGEGFDLLVIDDPVGSREEAESPAYRERVWDWYQSDLYPRLEPGASVILIMTRWHESDLAGRILASEAGAGWRVLSLPAVAESGDVLGRQPGEALWPERFDAAALADIRTTLGEYAFAALYQGQPSAREGNLFRVGLLEILPAAPVCARRVRAWDLAATDGAGDFTAGVLLGAEADGRYAVLDVVRGQWEPAERDRVIRQTAVLDGQGVAVWGPQDPGAGGKQAAMFFTRALAGWRVKTGTVTGNKVTRADPFAAQVNAGNVRLAPGPWNRDFIEELRTMPNGQHDDQVDAVAAAFAEVASHATAAGAIIGSGNGHARPRQPLFQRGTHPGGGYGARR
jgi:predicted phage terminase large subunit-like protein